MILAKLVVAALLLKNSEMKICLALFGITRSLSYTKDSIIENVINPLSAFSDFELVGHFYENSFVQDEDEVNNVEDHELLPFDDIQLQKADNPESSEDYKELIGFGDFWNNDFKSARNLFLQLNSLKALHDFPQVRNSDICVFLRPDLRYHTSFGRVIPELKALNEGEAMIPFWQHWNGGLNDRFAACKGDLAKSAYATRGELALEFCKQSNSPLQSEQLLQYSMQINMVKTKSLDIKASRVRANGDEVKEDFKKRSMRNWLEKRRLLNSWNL
jgi:hypothetical protein